MSIVGQFIAEVQRERRSGNVSSETEQHLKHEFRKLARDACDSTLAAAVAPEIDRLSREAATLHKLRGRRVTVPDALALSPRRLRHGLPAGAQARPG
jgi:hypothetical protein